MAGWGGGIRFASIQSRKVPGTAIGLSRSNPTHQIRVVTTPKRCHNNPGWGGGIRTPECQDQNLVPYHLATPQYERTNYNSLRGSNPGLDPPVIFC